MPVQHVDQWDAAKWDGLRGAIRTATTPEEKQAAMKAATDYKLSFMSADAEVDGGREESEPVGQPAG